MTDMTDIDVIQATAAGFRRAEAMILRHEPLAGEPTHDAAGNPVIGFGRRLSHFPLSRADGEFLLKSQLVKARGELDVRIMEVRGSKHSITIGRIAVLYVLATILGTRKLADWHPLWEALKLGDYPRAAVEIMHCGLLKVLGESEANQLRVAELLTIFMSGEVPETH